MATRLAGIMLATVVKVHNTGHRSTCAKYWPQEYRYIILAIGVQVHNTGHRSKGALYWPLGKRA